jgi:hypothetical protein
VGVMLECLALLIEVCMLVCIAAVRHCQPWQGTGVQAVRANSATTAALSDTMGVDRIQGFSGIT